MSFILLGILNSQAAAAGGGDYEFIQTVNGTGSSGSITFSNIPQNYKHLQIRMVARHLNNVTSGDGAITFNSDTGSNYAWHSLIGTGSSGIVSQAVSSNTLIRMGSVAGNSSPADSFGAGIIDILDYTNTSKNKTVRGLTGRVNDNQMCLRSGLWMSTAAITSITISNESSFNYTTTSRFSLYGIKG